MSSTVTYSISSSGGVVSGFGAEDVKKSFCDLFGVPADKASAYTDKQKLIKKDLTKQEVETYRANLEGIGLAVVVHAHTPGEEAPVLVAPKVVSNPMDSLSLMPTGDESEDAPQIATVSPTKAKGFCCPKCDLEQTPAKECTGCGIIFEKYAAASVPTAAVTKSATTGTVAETRAQRQSESVDEDETSEFSPIAFVVPVIVMIVCAFAWKYIAVSMDRESGLVAWAIGGAMGAAAVAVGIRGQAAAIACAVLVVMSIFGGKYLYMSSYQQEAIAIFSNEGSLEMQDYAEMINYEAKEFAQISKDDTSIKQFMLEYEYTDASEHTFVTDQEIADFREHMQPMLERGADSELTAADFLNAAVPELGAAVSESVWTWVFDSLGPIDLLFLLLGCGTAFRLVREAN